MPKKKEIINPEVKLNEKIDKLLPLLNEPATGCRFWKAADPHFHLVGVRPVNRTVWEVINKDGFNPYDKKTDENLFKCFLIFITENERDNPLSADEIEYKKSMECKGYIYLKNNDLFFIYEFIRNNA